MHRFLVTKTSCPDSSLKEIKNSSAQPIKFCSWNCNGFTVRLNTENKQNLEDFISFIRSEQPDVLTLQEVRMKNSGNGRSGCIDHSKKSPKCLQSDANLFAIFKRRVPEYSIHLSLAAKKYAGQAIFVRNTLQSPTISYTFDKTGSNNHHDEEGRIIIAEFEHIILISTYTPNNGVTEDKFQRRRNWDYQIETFLTAQQASGKIIVYQGDLNVAAEDVDLSGDPEWWRSQVVLQALDPQDIGQPGSTINEQKRFQRILKSAGLIDPWRRLHPSTGSSNISNNNIAEPIFTWRGASGPRYFGKGMRIDYTLVSESLLQKGLVGCAEVKGSGTDLQGFMGSDHCPVTLTLVEKWWTRHNNRLDEISANSESEVEGVEADSFILDCNKDVLCDTTAVEMSYVNDCRIRATCEEELNCGKKHKLSGEGLKDISRKRHK